MKRIEKILVPVDYSTTSGVALEAALSLAHSFGAAIEVLHVLTDGDTDSGAARMTAFLAEFDSPTPITSRVQSGVPGEVITALSSEYDLVVMGTHGRSGLDRLIVDSVAARVVQHAACPVLTIREPA